MSTQTIYGESEAAVDFGGAALIGCRSFRFPRHRSTAGSRRCRRVVALPADGGALLLLAGCREDMQNQPYIPPLREKRFLCRQALGAALIAGTVARGELDADTYF